MRIAVLLGVLVLGSGFLQAEEKKPLDFADLHNWQKSLSGLEEFADNAFIYEDKVTDHAQALNEYVGAPFSLPLEVQYVSWDGVRFGNEGVPVVTPRNAAEFLPTRVPFVIVKEPISWGVKVAIRDRLTDTLPQENLGEEVRPFAISIKIGELISEDEAKTLRKGDKVRLTGTVGSVVVGKVAPRVTGISVGIVISDARIERVAAE